MEGIGEKWNEVKNTHTLMYIYLYLWGAFLGGNHLFVGLLHHRHYGDVSLASGLTMTPWVSSNALRTPVASCHNFFFRLSFRQLLVNPPTATVRLWDVIEYQWFPSVPFILKQLRYNSYHKIHHLKTCTIQGFLVYSQGYAFITST